VALFIQVGGIFIYDRTFLNTVKTFWAK